MEALLDAGSRCCGSDEEICDDCRAVAAMYVDALLPIMFELDETVFDLMALDPEAMGAILDSSKHALRRFVGAYLAAQRKEFER